MVQQFHNLAGVLSITVICPDDLYFHPITSYIVFIFEGYKPVGLISQTVFFPPEILNFCCWPLFSSVVDCFNGWFSCSEHWLAADVSLAMPTLWRPGSTKNLPLSPAAILAA